MILKTSNSPYFKNYGNLTCETKWKVAVNMSDSISLMDRACTLKEILKSIF